MNILITGGAGFIGSHIVDRLIQNHNICVIDNFSSGKLDNINKNIKYYDVDINDTQLYNIFKKEKPDIVIHLAAQISVVHSQREPIKDAQTNIIGTLNLIKLSKEYGIKLFIAASSAAVYGDLPSPIKESCYPQPHSNYGISKLAMENYIRHSDLNYIILRFSNVYGERQNPKGEAGVITIFENLIKNNKPVYIYGDGKQIRDFIYVKDLASVVEQLINKNIKNDTINVSSGKGININDLFSILKSKYSYKQKPIYDTEREGDIKISILDNQKLLNYLPNFNFTSVKKHYELSGEEQ